jgi:hypothetical protein
MRRRQVRRSLDDRALGDRVYALIRAFWVRELEGKWIANGLST